MLRILCLNQHLTTVALAPGTARNLHDRLRESLGGAEVGAEQALVGVEHDHERDAWKMVTLGHHLRADQDACFTRQDASYDGVELRRSRRAVAIEPDQRLPPEKLTARF